MLSRLSDVFALKGYIKIPTTQPQAQVVLKITAEGIRYLCLIDDTQNWLSPEAVSRLLNNTQQYIQQHERFAQYAAETTGLAVIITNDPEHTRSFLQEGDRYWLIHQPTRRLMIFDDQPGDFGDARSCVEEYLNQNALRLAAGQLRGLFSPVNIGLIAVNIFVFVFLEILGSTEDVFFMHARGAVSACDILYAKEYYRLLTSAFMHFGTAHLLYNMIALLYLGKPLEQTLGSIRYLFFYLVCAVGANIVSVFWYNFQNDIFSVSAGASGAICGVAGGVAYVLLKNRKENKNFTFIRWAIFVALVAGQGIGNASVNNAAHIGGAVIGFFLGMLMYSLKKRKAAKEASR